jgi:NAD+ diphosphatase
MWCDAEFGSSSEFQLVEKPALSRSTVDRSEVVRDAPGKAAELWSDGRVLLVDRLGHAHVAEGDRLHTVPASEFGDQPHSDAVLLGAQGGVGYWAMRSQQEGATEGWQNLRTAGALLDDTDAGLLTTAVSLLNWHDRARYCSVCGATTRRVRTGWARECTGCEREEYPRTDAAVICLVHDGGDQVLLARGASWPVGRYSVLAGFVESGESLEACVHREILEEVGIEVSHARYLGSQPWPFPRSLMLGFTAIGDPDEPLHPADGEIAEARWVHRDHVLAAQEAGGETVNGLRMPPGASIAYSMLRSWATWRG